MRAGGGATHSPMRPLELRLTCSVLALVTGCGSDATDPGLGAGGQIGFGGQITQTGGFTSTGGLTSTGGVTSSGGAAATGGAATGGVSSGGASSGGTTTGGTSSGGSSTGGAFPFPFPTGGTTASGGSSSGGAGGASDAMCKNAACFDIFDCALFHADLVGKCTFTKCEGFVCLP